MENHITGQTRLSGLFASPSQHSISPLIHNTAFQALGIDAVYLAFEVNQSGLKEAIASIRTLNLLGVNLSMPNKQLACQLVDELSEVAALVGAINTIVPHNGQLIGYNTDGLGFMQSLAAKTISIQGKKMTMLGSGGAATAIIAQAAIDGVKEISVFKRKNQAFDSVKHQLKKIQEKTTCQIELYDLADKKRLEAEITSSALLVNGTPLGMTPYEESCPLEDTAMLRKELVVADLIYSPRETILIRKAKKQGCVTMNGLGMLLYQAAAAFKLWTGQEMPTEKVEKILEKI